MTTIKLRSSNDEIIVVDVKIAKFSEALKKTLMNPQVRSGQISVQVPYVSSLILKKVIEWAVHHADDASYVNEDDNKSTDFISEWDWMFLSKCPEELQMIIIAAEHLAMKKLLNLAHRVQALLQDSIDQNLANKMLATFTNEMR